MPGNTENIECFYPITGLPNKPTLLDSIRDALKAAREKRHGVTLLTCGLDRFHLINETFGHQAGDEILQEMATLLLRVVGSEASVSASGVTISRCWWSIPTRML
ncbi:diguanylate cyclase domain-containing protein [Halomonas sp.]|uniref:diguanylate cyclase domain-containing protein n=1 Tax=Halomonas sp. TaxID=1486246 RepID=UPI0039710075